MARERKRTPPKKSAPRERKREPRLDAPVPTVLEKSYGNGAEVREQGTGKLKGYVYRGADGKWETRTPAGRRLGKAPTFSAAMGRLP